MVLDNVFCSRSFREDLLIAFPILAGDQRYLRFIAYLLFGFCYNDDGHLLIPCILLATIEGESRNLKHHRYCGERFLEEVREKLLFGLRWGGWEPNPRTGEWQTRVVYEHGLPGWLIERTYQEQLCVISDGQDLVDLVTGQPVTSYQKLAQRNNEYDAATARLGKTTCDEQRRAMVYMNELPSNRFALLTKHLPTAREIILATQKRTPEQTADYRRMALNALLKFRAQPQAFYQPSQAGRSTRLFTPGSGLLQLPSAARLALTSAEGWVDLDLR